MTILTTDDLDLESTIHFNTGALYRDDGQHIYACKLKDGKVFMHDDSRGLHYVYDCELNQADIMRHYLNNLFLHGYSTSWQLGEAVKNHKQAKTP